MSKWRSFLFSVCYLVLNGCAYARPMPGLIEGKPQLADRARLISAGMNQSEVQAIIGEPVERNKNKDREKWKYRSVYQGGACLKYLFGVIPIGSKHQTTTEATVTFKSGAVIRVLLEVGSKSEELIPKPISSFRTGGIQAPANKRLQATVGATASQRTRNQSAFAHRA
mgnify:FL=1